MGIEAAHLGSGIYLRGASRKERDDPHSDTSWRKKEGGGCSFHRKEYDRDDG
jgi:hypothetical protein